MEKIELQAKGRAEVSAKHLRQDGVIPAVVYGHGNETTHLQVNYPEFERVFRKAGESTLVTLMVDGKPKNVIIQDVQRHYLTGKFEHVDFYEVSMTEKMKATVPLEFVGVSKAVKEASGILVHVLSEVHVECLPADLPHSLEVDISKLETFSDVVHIGDIKVSDKVKILAEADEVVAKVSPPRDVEAELAEPVVEDVSKVEGAAETPKEPAEGEAPTEEKEEKKEKAE